MFYHPSTTVICGYFYGAIDLLSSETVGNRRFFLLLHACVSLTSMGESTSCTLRRPPLFITAE